uniref:Nonstructural protein n=1 Tax=Bird gammacoronavirus AnasCN24 TaxID=3237959 RepID=A0AB39ADB8_9GAMC
MELSIKDNNCYFKEKQAAIRSRLKRVCFPQVIVKLPSGAWSYSDSFDFEPSVRDYTNVCSDKPLTNTDVLSS